MPTKLEIVENTKSWLGTPYKHAHSLKGVGSDCLGLLRGVWREVYGSEPEKPPVYGPGWFELNLEKDLLLSAACRYMVEKPKNSTVQLADVLIFRMHKNSAAKHCSIVIEDNFMIHAYSGKGVVVTSLSPLWLDRIAGHFAFPNIE